MSNPALVTLLLVVVGSMSVSMTDVRAQGPEYDCVDVDLPPEGVCIPDVEGVTWGFGDTGCGYGLEVWLPAGTRVCFNVDFKLVYVFDPVPADQVFVDIILDSAPPEYVLQPDTTPPSFTPTPTSTPSPVMPTPSTPTTPQTPATSTPTRTKTVVPPGPPSTGTGSSESNMRLSAVEAIGAAGILASLALIISLAARRGRR